MRSDEIRPVPPLLPSPVPEHPVDVLLTPARCQKYRQVLARRVKHICVVIEDCHDPHNATAVIRSCDAYGIHHVHVTTDRNKFKIRFFIPDIFLLNGFVLNPQSFRCFKKST